MILRDSILVTIVRKDQSVLRAQVFHYCFLNSSKSSVLCFGAIHKCMPKALCLKLVNV